MSNLDTDKINKKTSRLFISDFDGTIMFRSDGYFFEFCEIMLGEELSEKLLKPINRKNNINLQDWFIFYTDHLLNFKIAKDLFIKFKESDLGKTMYNHIRAVDSKYLNEFILKIENKIFNSNANGWGGRDCKWFYINEVLSLFFAVYVVFYHDRGVTDHFLNFFGVCYNSGDEICINTMQSLPCIEWVIKLLIIKNPSKYYFFKNIKLYGGTLLSNKGDENRIATILYDKNIFNREDCEVILVGDELSDAKNYYELSKYKNPSNFILSFPVLENGKLDVEKIELFLEKSVDLLGSKIIKRIKDAFLEQVSLESSCIEKTEQFGMFGNHFNVVKKIFKECGLK